jgi:hypothetical protein
MISKTFKIMIASIAIALTFSLSSAMADEPPCNFTDPCLTSCTKDWQEMTLTYSPCTNCDITITYLYKACSCLDEYGNEYDHYGVYYKSTTIPKICLSTCFSDEEDAVDAALQYFFDTILQPRMSDPNTEAIEFKTKACYELVDILEGDLTEVEPCEGMYGCCEYEFGTFELPFFGKLKYWKEVNSVNVCDVWGPNYNNCYSMCGKVWGILTFWNQYGILKPVTIEQYSFILAPNPTHDNISLQIPDIIFDEIKIQVFDINGNILFESKTKSDAKNININTSNYSSGNYYIVVRANDECIYSSKFEIIK